MYLDVSPYSSASLFYDRSVLDRQNREARKRIAMPTETPLVPQIPLFYPGPERKSTFQKKRHRFSPLGLIGVAVALLVILAAGLYFIVRPALFSKAANAEPNADCSLIVPADPLSAKGLATPYQLFATNPKNGPCNESNADQSAFVQSVIYDPISGTFSVYNPLVIDRGTKPAVTPTVPRLPQGAVVGIWFGFNATNLQLQSARNDTLARANCVNGLGRSLFTQFAYCNAPSFFARVNQGVVAHKVHIPALGTAKDGQTCPTVRDFSVVDQDQSDNVQTQYLGTANGRIAQFSAANNAALHNATLIANPSDNALLTSFINPALGCKAWTAPDLADDGSPVSALALDELQASAYQRAPIALVPLNNPMTVITKGDDTIASLRKTDLYRLGVDQIPAVNNQQASGVAYCQGLVNTGMPRLALDKQFTIKATTPDDGAANSLFTFLAQRLQGSYDNLKCPKLLNMPNPVKTTTDKNGVVIAASFKGQASTPPAASNAPDCSINGQLVKGCKGNTTINGQTCTLMFADNTVKLNCPVKQ